MNHLQTKTFQNATGKIDYTLTNDCMFQTVMRSNNRVLKGLLCALLRLNPGDVQTVTILNSFEYSEAIRNKTFILDFTLFPDHPEFYAAYKMMNVKKHYIYNDKFTLNVLDLNQTKLATDEDKLWKLDYWACLFKAKTWEDLKMLAQQDNIFEETCQTIFQKNQDDKVRYWCEALEEGERTVRTIEYNFKKELAEKDSIIAEKDFALREKDSALARQQIQIEQLMAEIKRLKEVNENN